MRLLVFVLLHGGIVQSGWAPHYAPGLMEQVARNRGMEQSACMVSSPIYPLGTQLWVYGVKTEALLLCTVVDVSQPRHRQGHIDRRIIVEIGHENTRQLCGTIRGSVKECPVVTIKL